MAVRISTNDISMLETGHSNWQSNGTKEKLDRNPYLQNPGTQPPDDSRIPPKLQFTDWSQVAPTIFQGLKVLSCRFLLFFSQISIHSFIIIYFSFFFIF